jgi:hypothetical protein
MTRATFKKTLTLFLTVVVGLAVLGATTVYFGARWTQARIVQLLEPYGQAERIHVRFSAVVLENLTLNTLAAGQDRRSARASQVVIEPDWRALLARRFAISTVSIDDFTLPARRTQDGKIQILPALTEQIKRETASDNHSASKSVIEIGKVIFTHGTLDFRDASVATPPHKIIFDQMRATIGPLQLPEGTQRTEITLSARAVGKQKSGPVAIKGWLMPASNDTDMDIQLRDVEIPLVAPYLRKGAPRSLVGGAMALEMKLRIQKKYLNAEGNVMLSDLQFNNSPLLFSLPRKAVLAALEDRQGKVSFHFSVQGQLDDPKFALDDSLSARIAGGFAKAIGVSVEGVAEGATGIVKGLGKAFTDLLSK